MKKILFIGFLLLGAFSMLVMSRLYFTHPNAGILEGKAPTIFAGYIYFFYLHILTGLVAIFIGPFQFIGRDPYRKSSSHKFFGYIYSLAVILSSISGIVIAQYAMGGMITRIGFSILSILWFVSIIWALRKVYTKAFKQHEIWMKINYAITFSAITQRTILLFAFLPAVPFMEVYQLSSWLSWIINLTIAFFLIKKQNYAL